MTWMSWWLLALVVAGLAPLGIRALMDAYNRRAHERTERVLARAKHGAAADG